MPTWLTKSWLLVTIATAIGAALRLYNLDEAPPGLYPDEAANGTDALETLKNGPQAFYEGNGGREGLLILLNAMLFAVTDVRDPWILRIIPALSGILTIPGIYLLGKHLLHRYVGVLAAFLMATSLWHVAISRVGFRASLGLLLITWTFAVLVIAIRKLQKKESSLHYFIGGGLLWGLSLYSYTAARGAIIPLIALLIWSLSVHHGKRYTKMIAGISLAIATSIIVALPLIAAFQTNTRAFTQRTQELSITSQDNTTYELLKNTGLTVRMLFFEGDHNGRHGVPKVPALPFLLIPFLIAGVIGLGAKAHHKRYLAPILITATTISGAIPAVITSEGVPHALRSSLLLIPLTITVAYGIWILIRATGEHRRQHNALAALILIGFLGIFGTYQYHAYMHTEEACNTFACKEAQLGITLRERDTSISTYVLVPDRGLTVNNTPIAAQSIMFLNNISCVADQQKNNLFFTSDPKSIPEDAELYDLR